MNFWTPKKEEIVMAENKGKSKKELDEIEKLIKQGYTKHQAQNRALKKDKKSK